MKTGNLLASFALGGGAYVGLEWLYRRRSHGSMFAAGGLSFVLIGNLPRRWPPAVRALAGGGIITAVELAAGLLVNRDHRIWDYRQLPGNFRGQICPAFSAVWVALAAAADRVYPLVQAAFKETPDENG